MRLKVVSQPCVIDLEGLHSRKQTSRAPKGHDSRHEVDHNWCEVDGSMILRQLVQMLTAEALTCMMRLIMMLFMERRCLPSPVASLRGSCGSAAAMRSSVSSFLQAVECRLRARHHFHY